MSSCMLLKYPARDEGRPLSVSEMIALCSAPAAFPILPSAACNEPGHWEATGHRVLLAPDGKNDSP